MITPTVICKFCEQTAAVPGQKYCAPCKAFSQQMLNALYGGSDAVDASIERALTHPSATARQREMKRTER